jgi:ABC-type multidrug transport system fused ATPase/permease subunit
MNEVFFSKPRWLLRFFQIIDRIPIPGWLLAVLLIVASTAVHHLVAWQQGYVESGQFDFSLSTHGFYFVFVPYTWIVLARRAAQDLRSFFSESGKGEEEIHEIIANFNSLPEFTSAIILVVGGLNGYFNYRYLGIQAIPLSEVVLPLVSALTWIISAILGYMVIARMIRQASLMQDFYNEIEVDLFKPDRIYALSRYGAFTSTVLLLLFYVLAIISFPNFIFTPIGAITQLLIFLTIVLLFFIPLTKINRRMRQAKEEMLNRTNENLRDLNDQIHIAAQKREYAALTDFQGPLNTLQDLKEMIKAIPTWPWQPQTLRNLAAPLLFPVLVYLVQVFLDRFMGL